MNSLSLLKYLFDCMNQIFYIQFVTESNRMTFQIKFEMTRNQSDLFRIYEAFFDSEFEESFEFPDSGSFKSSSVFLTGISI